MTTMEDVIALRDDTNLPLNICKKALERCPDRDSAIEWLRRQGTPAADRDEPKRPVTEPIMGSRWMRKEPYDPTKGPFNTYVVVCITNQAHPSPNHPPQVLYVGDNGNSWSLPLDQWPGNLVPYDIRVENEYEIQEAQRILGVTTGEPLVEAAKRVRKELQEYVEITEGLQEELARLKDAFVRVGWTIGSVEDFLSFWKKEAEYWKNEAIRLAEELGE